MADVRSLLRNERNSRRISHPQATYSTTGTLVCLVCRIQLKSESLWDGHLRSPLHVARLKKASDDALSTQPEAAAPQATQTNESEGEDTKESAKAEVQLRGKQGQKRKADSDEDNEEQSSTTRKRSKHAPMPGFLPEGFFDDASKADVEASPPSNGNGQEFRLPSRPATPHKAPEVTPGAPKLPTVDEDEWAAFEADIAAAEVATEATEDAVISAAPMTTEEIAAKSREDEMNKMKKKAEAELEGDKEDAVRKLEEEFEQMNELEERVRRLKEKREALRVKEVVNVVSKPANVEADDETSKAAEDEDDDDEDDEEDDDDWAGFRLRG